MGTAVSLHLADPLPEAILDRHAAELFTWLHQVDRRFSTYRSDSEVNQLDRGDLSIDRCSADLRAVLDRCADLWRSTDGWFDVYATKRLDPSGYVKGWAVQVASDRLVEAGLANHCINAGGDVRVQGRPASGQVWRIGSRHPWQPQHICWVLAGTDLAIATSGTYERGHHVIDPRNGEAATLRHGGRQGSRARRRVLCPAWTGSRACPATSPLWLPRMGDVSDRRGYLASRATARR
jgi:FAD:protein FMN transferase